MTAWEVKDYLSHLTSWEENEEEFDDEEEDQNESEKETQTGDDMNMALYGAAMLMALVAMVAAGFRRRTDK